ncbi:AAA family ATPase [Planococcus sp. YIM B11945]|uniref:ATP-binding protein n=1 Tax=Planococcus sp. YIM B11945 TaxID=3435410 RepID=UPI003D7CC08B
MKIEKLIIYGFGKHENRTIEVNSQMALFYGPNEAGKTTIQQFIVQTLFGYPLRNQSKMRYEPKSGGKYGGQIHVNDPKFGRVVIERVKGKAAGDVALFYEDGSRGGEAELKLLLRDYDRVAFESIFAFSIHELQGLDRMNEEELSRTLLASGTTGIDAITKMESRLEKEMGALFKKAGRNPEMNLLIEELKAMEKEVKDYRAQTEIYSPYIERLQEIENRLTVLKAEERRLFNNRQQAEKWLQSIPLLKKAELLKSELDQLGDAEFPVDGRRQMDRLQDRLSETTAKIDYVTTELAVLENPQTPIKEIETLERFLNRESEWHQLQTAFLQKQEELNKLTDEQQRLINLVGLDPQEILHSDVSLSREDQLIHHIQQTDLEDEEKRFAQRKLAEEKSELTEAQHQLNALLSQQPSDKERQEAANWPTVSMKLAEAKAAKNMSNTGNSQLLGYALAALGIIGVVLGILQTNYLVVGLAVLAGAIGAWIAAKSGSPENGNGRYDELLHKYGGKEAEFSALVRKVDEFDFKLQEINVRIKSSKEKVAALSSELRGAPAKQAYEHFLQELGVNAHSSRATVLDLFEKLRSIQAIHARRERLQQELEELDRETGDWLHRASDAVGKELSAEGLYASLRAEFSERQQQQAKQAKREEKKAELLAEAKKAHAFLAQVEKEKRQLLDDASVQDAAQFYMRADEALRREAILNELSPIQAQLAVIGPVQLPDGFKGEEAIENYISTQEAALVLLQSERNELLAEQADKQQTTKTLLSNGEYEEKLQQFEEKKAAFAEHARSWAINKAIIEAIRQTMDELKEKKLPAVISTAQSYFGKLTASAYAGLEMNPQGYFEAVRTDGARFHISELSQATKEQAYLALRLALAASMQNSHPFPIVMDDAFVHFDRGRLQQMINLITELQADHQFIYFTCHETMQQAWPNAQVIHVANIERSVHS